MSYKKPTKVVDLKSSSSSDDDELVATQEISIDDSDEHLHDEIELFLRDEVKLWLSEYGAKLFSLVEERWLTKQQKKAILSETSPPKPSKKRRIL